MYSNIVKCMYLLFESYLNQRIIFELEKVFELKYGKATYLYLIWPCCICI